MTTSTLEQSQLALALRHSPIPALRKLSLDESEIAVTIQGNVSSYYLKQLAQETLMPVLGDRELRNRVAVVREAAAVALGKIGKEAGAAVGPLVRLVGNSRPGLSAQAARALGDIGCVDASVRAAPRSPLAGRVFPACPSPSIGQLAQHVPAFARTTSPGRPRIVDATRTRENPNHVETVAVAAAILDPDLFH